MESKKWQPSRRDIGRLTLGVAAIGVGRLLQDNEVIKEKRRRIETPEGFFTGVYDMHIETISPERIPIGIDVLFRELATPLGEVIINPRKHLFTRWEGDNTVPRLFPEAVLAEVSRRNIPLMLGDIDENVLKSFFLTNAATIPTVVASAEGLFLLRNKKKKEKLEGTLPTKRTRRRRQILETGLLASLAWSLSPASSGILAGLFDGVVKNNAARTALLRFRNMVEHAHPEELTVFFRNLIMADKLLTVAQTLQDQTGNKPHIGFWVGLGHTGIEELLQAGADFCRTLIAAYPNFILRDLVKRNGGAEIFSSSMLYTLPKDLKSSEFQSPNSQWEGTSRVIVDTKLEKLLKETLN